MLETEKKEHRKKMEKVVGDLKHAYESIRTGRASTHLLDNLTVNAYGSDMPLIQLASLSTPDARTIAIQPFDANQISAIEKAIQNSDVGITPSNDGKIIRLNIPQLTEDRRQELVKLAHKYAEDHRITIRHIRHEFNDGIKTMQKDGDISEDDMHRALKEEQDIHDEFMKKIDDTMKHKEEEIMEV